ncbi:type I DNA topoisomerase [Rhodohalobacter sp. SW132]|uniref:type I DNA topoisomerase n=1 Tax=Rhodohalobacter sp. SW132 TaxID=2293433 RepID=UPI000E26DBF0|nr:type I DNA topoisomerase [Rhodohalobacter sp. SW132]REL38458.1 type I DNA topoisomerase [Rhodohalobacter sp. SW132]
MKKLVIVESPTKTKTIKKYLPKEYTVDSSMGHIRDLPSSAKEIPKKYKKESWSNLGINVDEDFEPLYVTPSSKKKIVTRLKKALKDSDELILATDEDREGEAISWHLVELLKPKVPVKRMVFREITKEAIQNAMENFRDIDMNLVHAQETRRILDRLAGYTISPLLWKKISPGLSAGRVQSVAVEFLVDRERERMRFKSGTYYDLKAELSKQKQKAKFNADLSHLNDKRLASGKDFDESTGKLKKPDSVVLLDEEKASKLRDELHEATWSVSKVDVKQQKRNPSAAFITSTLQQEANRKLGFSARDTMGIAQKLYERGLITYMRTDSANLSGQAINAARTAVEKEYGEEYLFAKVRNFGKSKGAQEAHEAIRPAGSSFVKPEDAKLSGREFKLYDLIWKRTIATQMAEAKLEFTNVTITAEHGDTRADFRTSGKKILFPGFFRAYVEGSDDPEAALENQEIFLPEMKEGEEIDMHGLESISHETKPPARYTEATLVKELEKRGVGRPSTYASIISTIQDRGYAKSDGKTLIPTFTAFAVTGLLEEHFPELVDSDFTSELEKKLDLIAKGEYDPLKYLTDYYHGDEGLKNKVDTREDKIDGAKARMLDLPLENLNGMNVFVGRYGPYVKSMSDGEEITTSLPNDMDPADISPEKLLELLKAEKEGPKSLGKDPETGEDIYVLNGRYGPYMQLGEVSDDNKKPKRVSLLKGMKPEDVDLELGLKLLELPRPLGEHPETGKVVKAGVGRYGPYVLHDGTFKSLKKTDDVLEIELDRAVELLKEKKGKGRGSNAIQDLGKHPETDQPIKVMDGRYGPYLKYGKKNVSLPDDMEPEKVTMADAVRVIDEKGKK